MLSESRFSAGATEKLPCSENIRISSWSCDLEGRAKKCVERSCVLANKTTQQLYKVSTPCIDDHHFKEEEWKSVGELSNVCSQIVLKCFFLARIGRPDILWAVNKLARSITKWTEACDKRLNRLISYIHHTCEYKQYCHVGNTAKQCRLGLFQDSAFAGDLEDSKSTSGGTLCVFVSHTFVPIRWMCKKQTSVSHSSTESKIISLDAGFWTVYSCLTCETWSLLFFTEIRIKVNKHREICPNLQRERKFMERLMIQTRIRIMLFLFPQNANSSLKEAFLYVFKDNEAVIKMVMKGRSVTTRHVSRTHWVALDWVFDRICLDPKTQIKCTDTENQLADILTKGNFTRDERNHLLCLLNISHVSSINKCKAMSKRAQEDTGEERVTAKSKPQDEPRCLDCIWKPGRHQIWKSECTSEPVEWEQTRTGRLVMGACSSNYSEWKNDDKWCSQGWKSGEMLGTSMRRPVDDKFVVDIDMDSNTAAKWDFSLKSRSLANRVNNRLRKMLDQSSKDSMQDIYKRSMIWWMFMSSTLPASVFMGKNYLEILHSIKKCREWTHFETDVWGIWTVDVGTISWDFWVSQLSWESSPWERWIRTQHRILFGSDSCDGSKIHHSTEHYTIDGEPMKFEWNIVPGFVHYIAACPRSPKVHEQNGRTC